MVKSTQRDRIWITALQNDNFSKYDITSEVDAGERTVHDVLKTMVDADLLTETTERRYVERGDYGLKQRVTVYQKADALSSETTEDDTSSDNSPMKGMKVEMGVGARSMPTQTHGETDDKPDAPASETDETVKTDARYVISCPECDYTLEREKNSKLVKRTRAKRQRCSECDVLVELIKDDRPNPPTCPECDKEVIQIKDADPHGDEDAYKMYVHEKSSLRIGGELSSQVDDSCTVTVE